MGERKVQAKYYPPDFDPSKIPRVKKKNKNEDLVRFMLPMSVRCDTCGEFMGTGLKFNAKKSDTGDNYLGIRIFRFSMKCKSCPATFTIRTDPKNSEYICDTGVRRNYEPWREKKNVEEEEKGERSRQDEDSMQALENKTIDAKRQMEDLDALDEIKSNNAKRAAVNVDDVIARGNALRNIEKEQAEIQMLEEAKMAFLKKKITALKRPSTNTFDIKPSVLPAALDRKPDPAKKELVLKHDFKLKIKKKIKKTVSPRVSPSFQTSGLVNYQGSSSDSD